MIHIIHFSDGHKHFSESIKEYEKRLGKTLTIHTLKPQKHTDIQFIRQKETEKLIEKIGKMQGKIIVCDENGEHYTTKKFANSIKNVYNSSENIIFIIGWSYGLEIEKIEKNFPITAMKLSEMVMPHSLAFLVLIEQIYRSFEIMKGSNYHHE